MARPEQLPGTNLFAAFERDGVVVPAPVPVVPTPVPTLAPMPPTATAVPPVAPTATPVAVAQPPAQIEVTGGGQFQEQVREAIRLVETKSPYNYQFIRQNVYRVEEVGWPPNIDLANRTLRIDATTAFPNDWSDKRDQQQQWLAGLIVHNAIHIAQYQRGAPTEGPDAEREALERQLDTLSAVEVNLPPAQFVNLVREALNNNSGWFGHWQNPRGPRPTPTGN